nr:hypothetical protein [Tanacetum cinerariifolium]
METVFHINNCPQRIVGTIVAYAMTWKAIMKLMTEKLKGYDAKNAENMRMFDNNSRDNRMQQPPLRGKMLADRMWQGHTRLGTMRRKGMMGLYSTATSVDYIMRGSVL